MNRQCRVCDQWYPDGQRAPGVPQGICSRKCAADRRRQRASERASRRAVPPRSPSRLFTASSRDWTEARSKVEAEGACRVCPSGVQLGDLQAAHIIPRSIAPNGGEHPDGIVPLCSFHHTAYDGCILDLTPFLSVEEQAHAVVLAGGLVAALRVISGQRAAA